MAILVFVTWKVKLSQFWPHFCHHYQTKLFPYAALMLSFCCWQCRTASPSGKPFKLGKWCWLCLFTEVRLAALLCATKLTTNRFSIETVKMTIIPGHLVPSVASNEKLCLTTWRCNKPSERHWKMQKRSELIINPYEVKNFSQFPVDYSFKIYILWNLIGTNWRFRTLGIFRVC